MKINKNLTILTIFLTFFCQIYIYAQEQVPIVEFGETKIKLNEPLVISILVKNTDNKPICRFPELKGFKKRGTSSAVSNSIINGKQSTDHRVSQEYIPLKSGQFPFSNIVIIVNEFAVNSNSFSVSVAESDKDEIEENFKDFIDGSAYEFVDVKDDAFFAITTNKLRPYIGEGFLITIAFYIARNNKAEMAFINENGQLDNILTRLKPKNCWEENLKISEIKAKQIKISNKIYFQYKIYQALYYPFNNQPIVIPTIKWQMRKYKIAKDQELSQAKKEDIKNYFSKPIYIKPLPLPKNNNFKTDFVGDFYLEEDINKEKVQTGKSFNYTFRVIGNGNLTLLKFPETLSDTLFEIYNPVINQKYSLISGKLMPEKSFSFDIVPKFAGKFSLKNHFLLSYFNVRSKSYQTLQAGKEIEVVGRDIEAEAEPILNDNELFDNLDQLKSSETSFDFRQLIQKIANFLVVIMLFSMIYIIWPNFKK